MAVCSGTSDSSDSISSILDIKDLNTVLTELKEYSKANWQEFGLEAGLYKKTLDEIGVNKIDVQQRFIECLSFWLNRKDGVDDQGQPSWLRLAKILENIGAERALVDKIQSICSNKEPEFSSSTTHSVVASDHTICLPQDLENKYLQLATEFSVILTLFVNGVCVEEKTLKDIKTLLIGINPSNKKQIDEVYEESGLMYVIRSYCSVSNFQILTSLTENMNMDDIMNKLLQFKKKREKLYKEILAKDFARSAIEYCGTMNSREMTFEVLWPINKATLHDFEQFLAAAFRRKDLIMHIHLKAVHSSLLTFTCIIPYWLVKEIKDYVAENRDLIVSKDVIEITVDGTIIFSMKKSVVQEPCELSLAENLEEYACLLIYEKDSYLLFTAVPCKKLTALLEYIKDHHQFAELSPVQYFHFKLLNRSFVELNFDKKPSPGWNVIPLIKPCRLYKADIDMFDGTDRSIPPFCFITVHGSSDAMSSLNYSVPMEGVIGCITLCIQRTLKGAVSPTEKLKADITMLTEMKSQLEEKNDNLIEENEKLESKVGTFIATLRYITIFAIVISVVILLAAVAFGPYFPDITVIVITVIVGVGVVSVAGLKLTTRPSSYCRALFYKKCLPDKVILSLAVVQDLASSNKLLQDPLVQSHLGSFDTSFRFKFSRRLIKVTNIPSESINGWRITLHNTDHITESHVIEYIAGKSAELPYIQLLVKPVQDNADYQNFFYVLPIEGTHISSNACWTIEASKNDFICLSENFQKLEPSIAMLTEEKSQLEEKNENSTKEIQKLKAKVVDQARIGLVSRIGLLSSVGGVAGVAAAFAVGASALPLTAIGATAGAVTAYTTIPGYAPSFYCALLYKKCLPDKVILSLAVVQDKLIEKDMTQLLLGTQISSFHFQFCDDKSHGKDCFLRVGNFPSDTIDGWRIRPFNPPTISKSLVSYYNSSSTEPPYIQVSVEPDKTDATNKISHALSIDGIQTSSDASTVQWNIEVSKNDLLPTTPSSIIPSVFAAASTARAKAEGTVDLDIAKGKVKDVLMKNQVLLKRAFSLSLQSISNELFQVGIISQDIHRSPSYDDIIGSFLAGLTLIRRESKLKERCETLIAALSDVGGPVARAADMLREDWEQAMNM